MKVIDEQTVFAVNLDCEPQKIEIDDQRYYIQIDNFYANPYQVLELASSIPVSQSARLCSALPTNADSGRSTTHYDLSHLSDVINGLIQTFYPRQRSPQSIRHTVEQLAFMCQVMSSEQLPALAPHVDTDQPGRFAATIGLTPTELCRGGTGFYTVRARTPGVPTEYVCDSTSDWQLDGVAELAWNRLILYPSSYWHSAYIKPTWYLQPNLRVTQQFFI
jgi:hypothetical protein